MIFSGQRKLPADKIPASPRRIIELGMSHTPKRGVAREFGGSSSTRAFPRERGNGEQGECINSIRTKAVASGTNCYLFGSVRALTWRAAHYARRL